ncbi:hypothetical protein LCGC14_1416060 [marine sediment metagenome]|uniref:TIR domain-containing protein n=1 Tax=marine sediment metagenome TaxID=412755 RepID=A0A0F9MUJ4_9ZZZZ
MQPELTESIEKTDIFLIVLSEYYHEDPECIEQVLYAKNLGKPMLIVKDINLVIPDIFERCIIIGIINELESAKETGKLIRERLNKWKRS